MKSKSFKLSLLVAIVATLAMLSGCSKVEANTVKEAPPAVKVVRDMDVTLFAVEHPEQFPLATVTEHVATSELVVTGTVAPDVSRSVPVVSLAAGRVTAIHARLGDTVKAGQLLLSVRSDDVASGFADYRKAVRDEVLSRQQLERAQDLFSHGAMSKSDLQIAEDTEDKAKIDVETTEEHLRLLGSDPNKPIGEVAIFAPVAGVITDQQITNSAGVQGLGSTPFTISDLSNVWIVCDVYENDMASVRLGDAAEIRLNAYPDRVLRGRVSNILPIMDPQLRTAKVRIEVQNPGIMRLGMFVKATFRGQTTEVRTVVPPSAILHIHDRDYVYLPGPDKKFRRMEVISGEGLADNRQGVKSGLKAGQLVVSNALVLEHTIDQ